MAYASYEENIKGTIEQRKLADYVILKEDIFTINPMRIKDVCVVETCLGGKTVYHNNVSHRNGGLDEKVNINKTGINNR